LIGGGLEEGEKKKEAQVLAFCGGGKSKKKRRGERERARACWIAHVEKGAAACLFGAEKQKKSE